MPHTYHLGRPSTDVVCEQYWPGWTRGPHFTEVEPEVQQCEGTSQVHPATAAFGPYSLPRLSPAKVLIPLRQESFSAIAACIFLTGQ